MTELDFEFMSEKLSSSVVSDVLDGMGYREQALTQDIRPLDEDMVIVGRAATMIMANIYDPEANTFELQMKAIDNLKQDEVLMVCSNKSTRAALWGELLSTASYYRGAKGAIIDGLCRDIRLIKEMNFPVFANGIRPISSKGRCICIDYNCPAEIGGVLVNPGDIVFADADGVVVIPEKIAEDTIQEALKVVERETKTRDELREGSLLSDVFMKYGTL